MKSHFGTQSSNLIKNCLNINLIIRITQKPTTIVLIFFKNFTSSLSYPTKLRKSCNIMTLTTKYNNERQNTMCFNSQHMTRKDIKGIVRITNGWMQHLLFFFKTTWRYHIRIVLVTCNLYPKTIDSLDCLFSN